MAGKFGCCAGGGTFGSGSHSPFGDPNWIGPSKIFGGGKDSSVGGGGDPIELCDGSDNIITFTDPQGKPQDPWPVWAGPRGCGFLSLLAANQIKHGKKAALKGRQIYSPGNFKKLSECFKKCSGGMVPTLRGQGKHDKKNMDCWKKCKIELMHGLGININPKFWSWGKGSPGGGGPGDLTPFYPPVPATLCPPLCIGTLVVVGLRMMVMAVDPNTGAWEGFMVDHVVSGKTVCCTKSKKICFDLQDYSPQHARVGRICVGQNGMMILILKKDLPFGSKNYGPIGKGEPIHGEAYCRRCMADPKCRAALGGKKCFEHNTSSSWVTSLYTEDAPTACPKGPGLYLPCR